MEQYEDIKSELQQELHDLQQNVEQHSTFNNDAWRETVKQSSNELYWHNAFLAGATVVITIAATIASPSSSGLGGLSSCATCTLFG